MEHPAKQLLIDLVESPSPTGFEGPAVKTWLKYLKPYSDEQFTDQYGNGFSILNPAGSPSILVTGHADEIGLMVTYIDDEGFLWVGSLGGYDPKILPAMRVKVFGKQGVVPGVIGAVPPHLQAPAPGGVEIKRYKFGENVYVDIGVSSKKESEALVKVGSPIILDYGFQELSGNLVCSRGLDNKIGIWAAAECLRRCSGHKDKLQAKVIAMATVQEEIGGHGAAMGAFATNPDAAIAVDVTQSLDHPGTDKKKFGSHRLDSGPVLAHGAACHPALVERLEKTASKKRINLQHEALPGRTGTDADSIFHAREGIPTAVLSVAQRYMHSPCEVISFNDLDMAAQLLAEFCLGLKKTDRFKVKI